MGVADDFCVDTSAASYFNEAAVPPSKVRVILCYPTDTHKSTGGQRQHTSWLALQALEEIIDLIAQESLHQRTGIRRLCKFLSTCRRLWKRELPPQRKWWHVLFYYGLKGKPTVAMAYFL